MSFGENFVSRSCVRKLKIRQVKKFKCVVSLYIFTTDASCSMYCTLKYLIRDLLSNVFHSWKPNITAFCVARAQQELETTTNLLNRFFVVQIPWGICTRFARHLNSMACSSITKTSKSLSRQQGPSNQRSSSNRSVKR